MQPGTAERFCGGCGAARPEAARFCAACGVAFGGGRRRRPALRIRSNESETVGMRVGLLLIVLLCVLSFGLLPALAVGALGCVVTFARRGTSPRRPAYLARARRRREAARATREAPPPPASATTL